MHACSSLLAAAMQQLTAVLMVMICYLMISSCCTKMRLIRWMGCKTQVQGSRACSLSGSVRHVLQYQVACPFVHTCMLHNSNYAALASMPSAWSSIYLPAAFLNTYTPANCAVLRCLILPLQCPSSLDNRHTTAASHLHTSPLQLPLRLFVNRLSATCLHGVPDG